MNTRLFSCLFLVLSLVGYSQENHLDSLTAVPPSQRDTIWIDQAISASYREVYNSPSKSAGTLLEAASLAEEKGFDSKLARIYLNQGICYDVMSKPDSALFFYRKGLKVAVARSDTNMIASAHNNIGLIHWNLEVLDSAIIHYKIAEDYFASINQRRGLTSTMNNIGLIYNSMFRFDDAIKYFKKVLTVAIADSSKYFEAVAYQNMAISFNRAPLYDSAAFYLDKAIPIQKEINNNWGLAKSYHSRGSVKIILTQMDEAVDDFRKAIAINKRLNNLNALASNYFRLSIVFPYFGKYEVALTYLDSARMLCPQIDDIDLCRKVDQSHALLSVRNLDVQLYERLDRSIDITDSLYSEKLDGRILELQEKYEAEKKEQELQIQNLKIAEQEQAAVQRERTILGLIVLVVILILFSFLFVRYRSKLSKLNTQQRLAAERSRISRDLHDNIGAQLTAMSTRIDLLDGGKQHSDELGQIRDEAADTVSMLRDTIWAMHREEFTVPQFMSRIRQYAKRVLPPSIKLDLHFDTKLEDKHLNSSEALNLFRIAQEAIQNSLKHSDASTLSINLRRRTNGYEFLISDNGKGCVLNEISGEDSYGLQNIRERSAEIKGQAEFESAKDDGFSIKVAF